MALAGGVSILAFVSVFTIGVGFLLHIIGLATTEWSALHVDKDNYGTVGLWKMCANDDVMGEHCYEHSSELESDDILSSIRSCEAFASLGALFSFLGLATAVISVLFPMMGKPKNAMLPVISLAGCVAASVSILIAIIVWGAKVQAGHFAQINLQIGYSFILSLIGGGLIGQGGVLFLLANGGDLNIR